MEHKKVNGLQKQTDDIVKSLENIFKGLPHLPENVLEVLVKIAPWLALIFGALGVLGSILAMFFSPLALFGGVQTGAMVLIIGLLGLAMSALTLAAYPKLANRSYTGWIYLFWAEIISIVSALLSVSLGSVLGVVIGLYLLFEVKKYYK